jgi:hypothetical protein
MLTGDQKEETEMARAAWVPNGSLAIVCMSSARAVTMNLAKLGRRRGAEWFDPTNGKTSKIPRSQLTKKVSQSFTPPSKNSASDSGRVLVLCASSRQ